jgi:hypothetical protein
MLRFAVALLATVVVTATAESADRPLAHSRWHGAAVRLPAGLPRPHYHFRTTITYATPYTYRRPSPRLSVYEAPELLYAPVVYADVPYVRGWAVEPLLPGYYGTTYSYEYPGSYYGGPYAPYWDRLPYACGVYGYC